VEPVRVPSEAPKAKPLRHRAPERNARELPGGRGFLRVVQGGKSPQPPASPEPSPETPPPAPEAPAKPAATPVPDDRQLSLLDWRPKPPPNPLPPKGTQLSLFDR